jgi:hypothetical protein
MKMESGISRKTINIEVEKTRFHKKTMKKQTIIFDFDETLAKVHFNKKELPVYDD